MKPIPRWDVYHWADDSFAEFYVDKSDEDSDTEDLEMVAERYRPLQVTADKSKYFAELVFHLKTQTMQGFDPSMRKVA